MKDFNFNLFLFLIDLPERVERGWMHGPLSQGVLEPWSQHCGPEKAKIESYS